MWRKTMTLVLSLSLLTPCSSPAQSVASVPAPVFRPAQLRYFQYDSRTDGFRLLLDPGSQKDQQVKPLLEYFLIGLTLPDDSFWVNLRPDSPERMIDPYLAQTDAGRIMLEADLQLKKDTALFTSPNTPEGKAYWDKLYKKAQELYGKAPSSIPTLTRPWIVPGEIIVRESNDSAYIYKGLLDVKLEQDHLKGAEGYSFPDAQSKTLNEYSSQLIRETILPRLVREVNSSRKYAALRQVYYGLILARWFKTKFAGRAGTYPSMIDSRSLTGLTSRTSWSTRDYFNQYQRSFDNGEYDVQEGVATSSGRTVRRYFSGGISMMGMAASGFRTGEQAPQALFSRPGTIEFEGKAGSGQMRRDGGMDVTIAMTYVREYWDLPSTRLRNAVKIVAEQGDAEARREVIVLMNQLYAKEYEFDYSDQTQRETEWDYARQVEQEWQDFAQNMINLVQGTPLNQPGIRLPRAVNDGGAVKYSSLDEAMSAIRNHYYLADASIEEAVKMVAAGDDEALKQEVIGIMTGLETAMYNDIFWADWDQRAGYDEAVLRYESLWKVFGREMVRWIENGPDYIRLREGEVMRGRLADAMEKILAAAYGEPVLRWNAKFIADNGDAAFKNKVIEAFAEHRLIWDANPGRARLDLGLMGIVGGEAALAVLNDLRENGNTQEIRRAAVNELIRQQVKRDGGSNRSDLQKATDLSDLAVRAAETDPQLADKLFNDAVSTAFRIYSYVAAVRTAAVISTKLAMTGRTEWARKLMRNAVALAVSRPSVQKDAMFGDIATELARQGLFTWAENVAREIIDARERSQVIGGIEKSRNSPQALSSEAGPEKDGGRPLAPGNTGGVDFRVMQIDIQPVGSFSGLNLSLPALSPEELARINVGAEVKKLRNMIDAGFEPSGQRMRELASVSVQKREARIGELLQCVSEIFQMEEEKASQSAPELKEALVILDSQG